MASRALPLLLLGGGAALLIAKGREEPEGEPDSEATPYAGSEGGQSGDVRWSIRELDSGDWEWRAWRWTVGFSQTGWKEIGATQSRSDALILAKEAAAELAELDGARLEAVEDQMISVQNYPSRTGSPYNNYAPLKRVLVERRIGPKASYGINIYEDDLTRQDGRYIGYLVIPEVGSQTIRRSKSEREVADDGARIDGLYNLLMLVVNQYW